MQGFEVATAKKGSVGFRDERTGYIWDWDSPHTEGYLNGCICTFV